MGMRYASLASKVRFILIDSWCYVVNVPLSSQNQDQDNKVREGEAMEYNIMNKTL